jgi:hypothetical protein
VRAYQRGAVTQALLVAVVVVGTGAGVGLQQAGVLGGGETAEVRLERVSAYDCPDGASVGDFHRGDRVLATGRDESGEWIEVRSPVDLGARVWLRTEYLVPDGDLSGLDVRECAPAELAAAVTTTTAAIAGVPTTVAGGGGSSGGGGGGGPAPPADTTGPTITGATVSEDEIWESPPPGTCPDRSTINAQASDPSGVASFTASWQFATVNQPPTPIPAVFGPFPSTTTNNFIDVTITITARDTRGNTSTATVMVTLWSNSIACPI